MTCSAFQPFGVLAFSSQTPRQESIYRSIVSMQGGNFEDTFSGPMNAEWYATAMAVGAARDTLERAEKQANPATCHELLPVLETMYGVAPAPTDSSNTRRATLSARYLVPLEPSVTAVSQALRILLGSDFRAWIPTTGATPYPPPSQPLLCKPPLSRIKVIQMLDPVRTIGVTASVRYQHLYGDTVDLLDGETVAVEPWRGLDFITVHGAANGLLTGTFAYTHDAGALCTVQPFPLWASANKNSLVVVKNGRASDLTLRSRVTDLLTRMLSGTSTWDVVQESSTPNQAGPIQVGVASIGIVPIGAKTFTA